mgnify:CR=1 FL=1
MGQNATFEKGLEVDNRPGGNFNILAGIKTQHMPYKGTGLVLTDMVGGQVQLFFAPPAALIPFIKADKLKGLTVTTENRMTALPGVPTFAEAGLPPMT